MKTKLIAIFSVFLLASPVYASEQLVDDARGQYNDVATGYIVNLLTALGLGSLVGDIVGLIRQNDEAAILIAENRVPDLQTIRNNLDTLTTTSGQLQNALEGKTISHAVTADQIKDVTRSLIEDSLAKTTTSEDARTEIKKTSRTIVLAAEENAILASESQASDVSQQILQNISQQLNLQNQTIATIAQQNLQAQTDQANSTLLSLQLADLLNEESTRRRIDEAQISQFSSISWASMSNPIYVHPNSTFGSNPPNITDLEASTNYNTF